jgi:hypothetical protein
MGPRASDGGCGGRQSDVLTGEVAAERVHCRFILTPARRI